MRELILSFILSKVTAITIAITLVGPNTIRYFKITLIHRKIMQHQNISFRIIRVRVALDRCTLSNYHISHLLSARHRAPRTVWPHARGQ